MAEYTISFDTCPRCGYQPAECEDRDAKWLYLRCGKCHNRGRYPAVPEDGARTEWEHEDDVLSDGLSSRLDDIRVIAGKSAAGIWVKLEGLSKNVLPRLDESTQARVKIVLGEHLD